MSRKAVTMILILSLFLPILFSAEAHPLTPDDLLPCAQVVTANTPGTHIDGDIDICNPRTTGMWPDTNQDSTFVRTLTTVWSDGNVDSAIETTYLSCDIDFFCISSTRIMPVRWCAMPERGCQ